MANAKKNGGQLERLTLDQLLAVDDRPEAEVDVPEWGGSVKVKALSLASFQKAMEDATVGGKVDEQRATLHMLLAGVVEPPLTEDHYEMLRQKSVAPITRIVERIAALSGTDAATQKDAEATFQDKA